MSITLVSRRDHTASPSFVRDFKSSMALNASTVAIICCEFEGVRYGLSATSVVSLSVDPPSVLTCIGQNAEAHAPMCEARAFSVSFLTASQNSISDRFAGLAGERNEQKFVGAKWIRGDLGTPVLENAAFALECEVAESYRIFSHTVIAGIVRSIWRSGEMKPLIYYNRKYSSLVADG